MPKTDMNTVAVRVTKREGGKISISNAQTKEVLRCLREECHQDSEAWSVVQNYLRYSKVDDLRSKRGGKARSTRHPNPAKPVKRAAKKK